MRTHVCLLTAAAALLLSGCELLGIPSPERIASQREAEGKAVGAACRHAGRAIEDCYNLNKRAEKAAVFAGWREMNDYMTENKIGVVAPTLPAPGAPGSEPEASEAKAGPGAKTAKRS
jgi:hypothetical protein